MIITVTRKFEFDAAHRILGHEGKCKHLHGHRYGLEVTLQSPELDSLGRVIDFGEIKKLIGDWIDQNWDHNILLNDADPLAKLWSEHAVVALGNGRGKFAAMTLFNGRAPYLFSCNPTAENIAIASAKMVRRLVAPFRMSLRWLRVYETPNCWADYDPS